MTFFITQEEQFVLKFNHLFNVGPTETTYFAFCYPWSFEESQAKIVEIENKIKLAPPEKNLYFHREVVYYSIEGRPMEMITISSKDGITDERETIPKAENSQDDVSGLFPEAVNDPERRPFKFDPSKKVVFFTSRVHPGETPGSFVLNGALDLITDLDSL